MDKAIILSAGQGSRLGHLTDDTMPFAHDLLARTGVAVAPGVDFDTESGHRFVRFSFAGPEADPDRGPATSPVSWQYANSRMPSPNGKVPRAQAEAHELERLAAGGKGGSVALGRM